VLSGLCACDALRIDAGKGVSRRAAIGGAILPALFVSPAFAKYRPSLAEMKGFGSSPVVDEMKEAQPVKTELTHAQLVANSCEMQKKLLGRDLTESEVAEIDAKIRKYYPDAQK